MTVSALDHVAGLGEVRRKALVRHFGSVAALRKATVEDILEVPGVGRRTAESVVEALAAPAKAPQAPPARTGNAVAPDSTRTPLPRAAQPSIPIPSSGTQDSDVPVNGVGDGVRTGA
jgi:excinuclease ABC subunit C